MNRYSNRKSISKRTARHIAAQGTPRPTYKTATGKYRCVKLGGTDWGNLFPTSDPGPVVTPYADRDDVDFDTVSVPF